MQCAVTWGLYEHSSGNYSFFSSSPLLIRAFLLGTAIIIIGMTLTIAFYAAKRRIFAIIVMISSAALCLYVISDSLIVSKSLMSTSNHRSDLLYTFKDYHGAANKLMWSSDGKLPSYFKDGTIETWDAMTGHNRMERKYYNQALGETVLAEVPSPDGKLVASLTELPSEDRFPPMRLQVFDVATGLEIFNQDALVGWINQLAWSPVVGSNEIAFSERGTIFVWNVRTHKNIITDSEQEFTECCPTLDFIYGLVWSPDGRFIASVGVADLRVWEIATKKVYARRTSDGICNNLISWQMDGVDSLNLRFNQRGQTSK
jgi:WD40 repeat protein